jgi:hypothetical protein
MKDINNIMVYSVSALDYIKLPKAIKKYLEEHKEAATGVEPGIIVRGEDGVAYQNLGVDHGMEEKHFLLAMKAAKIEVFGPAGKKTKADEYHMSTMEFYEDYPGWSIQAAKDAEIIRLKEELGAANRRADFFKNMLKQCMRPMRYFHGLLHVDGEWDSNVWCSFRDKRGASEASDMLALTITRASTSPSLRDEWKYEPYTSYPGEYGEWEKTSDTYPSVDGWFLCKAPSVVGGEAPLFHLGGGEWEVENKRVTGRVTEWLNDLGVETIKKKA